MSSSSRRFDSYVLFVTPSSNFRFKATVNLCVFEEIHVPTLRHVLRAITSEIREFMRVKTFMLILLFCLAYY